MLNNKRQNIPPDHLSEQIKFVALGELSLCNNYTDRFYLNKLREEYPGILSPKYTFALNNDSDDVLNEARQKFRVAFGLSYILGGDSLSDAIKRAALKNLEMPLHSKLRYYIMEVSKKYGYGYNFEIKNEYGDELNSKLLEFARRFGIEGKYTARGRSGRVFETGYRRNIETDIE